MMTSEPQGHEMAAFRGFGELWGIWLGRGAQATVAG